MQEWLSKAAAIEVPFTKVVSKSQEIFFFYRRQHIKPFLRVLVHRLNEYYFFEYPGIGNNDFRLAFSDMCRLHHPSLVFIADSVVSYDSIPSWFRRNVHVNNYCLNNRGGPLLPYLWAVWGSDFVYTVIFVSSQCLVLEGNCCADGLAAMGHDITDTTWFNTLPSSLLADFARDRHGLPNYRFS